MKMFRKTFALRMGGALLFAVTGALAAGGTMSGEGTAESPFQIEDIKDLRAIGTGDYSDSSNYVLVEDIDGSSADFEPIDCAFRGVFDGQKHTISNLTIDKPDENAVGLFGYAKYATIKNLTLKNVKVTGKDYVGALAGDIDDSRIDNVFALNCDVRGVKFVGGLVGAAGYLGRSGTTELNIVAGTGSVWGIETVGGVVGHLSACMTNTFSVSVIKGYENVGGIAGEIGTGWNGCGDSEEIVHAYSASIIKAPEPSGIIGRASSSYGYRELNMSDVYFDSTVAENIHEDEGRRTSEMLKKSTYEGFDFESVWTIREGKSYPYFFGMDPVYSGDLKDDGTVNMLSGFGTEAYPYLISSYEDLKYVGKYEYATNLYYKVTTDIDASESVKDNCDASGKNCKGFEPIGHFTGVFMGNRKEISNLTIRRPDEDSVGLFRSLDPSAKVSEVILLSANIRGKNYVGGLAGVDFGTTRDSIYVRGNVYGENYVGSIAGYKKSGTLNQNASKGTVTGDKFVGGLVGYLDSAKIVDSYSIDHIQGDRYVGGLVGYSRDSKIGGAFAVGRVDAESDRGGVAGGKSDTLPFGVAYYDSSLWHLDSTFGDGALSTEELISHVPWGDPDDLWDIEKDSTYPYLFWIWWERVTPGVNAGSDKELLRMDGFGIEDDPFLVKTYADLKSIGKGKYALSAVYRLANDIDASASKTENENHPAYRGFEPIGNRLLDSSAIFFSSYGDRDTAGVFTGKFHGGGHAIKNLYVEAVADSVRRQAAFITRIGAEGLVDSLYLTAAVDGDDAAGIAVVNEGTIAGSVVDIVVKHGTEPSNAIAGGIVAFNEVDAVVSDCRAKVNIEADSIAGGIVAVNAGTVSRSTALGTIDAKTIKATAVGGAVGWNYSSGLVDGVGSFVNLSGERNVGGFVGVNKGFGEVVHSFATGTVRGLLDMPWAVAGFVAENDGFIRQSYSTGDVYNGIAFAASNSRSIEDCYSTSNVYESAGWKGSAAFANASGKNALVRGYATGKAYRADGTSYCVQQNTRGSNDEGFYFINENCYNYIGTGLKEEDMRKQESFALFDFDSVWTIKEGKSYPKLRGVTNVPVAGNAKLVLKDNKSLVKAVQQEMDDTVIDMDNGSDKVLVMEPASEKLLDSLAKAKSVSGKFELVYRVGIKVGNDTLWGNSGHIELRINYQEEQRIETAAVHGRSFAVSVQENAVAIRFEVSAPGAVKFALLDMQGRLVKFADFGNRAAGAYFETVSTGAVPPGRYIGVLQVNGVVAKTKELVIR